MDENGYYPLTEDLILFYDTYAVGAGVYTFYVTGDYNEDNVWMYCMRTATFPVNTVNSWNLVLDDDLKVNFNVNIADAENETINITVGGNAIEHTLSNVDGQYIATISLAAAQMNDVIKVEISGGNRNFVDKTYTVRQYAEYILTDANDEFSAETEAMVKAMLIYGGAAQVYFDHNTENLANTGITDEDAVDIPETTTDMTVSGEAEGISFYGASLVYRDKIAVRFYFNRDVTGCTFTVGGNTYAPVEKDGKYYVEIADILPQNLDDQITLTVTDASGNELSVSYGPMNYIVRMNAKGSENLKTLLKALYNYHLAAEALREAV